MARSDPAQLDRRAASLRRWPRVLLAAGVLVLGSAMLAAVTAWLLTSERGNAWLLEHLPGVTVVGATGQLSSGPFSVARLDFRIGGRTLAVHGLAWKAARWQWRPHDGTWVALTLVEPSAERIDVSGPAVAATATTTPVLPTSLRLPMALTLEQARIGALNIAGQAPLTELRASIALGARGGREHRIGTLAFAWDRALVQAQATLGADAPYALAAQADLRSREGATPPWQARLTAQGPLAKLAVQARLGSTQAPGAALRADATVQPFQPWPLAMLSAAMQDLDLARLGSGLPSTQLSGRADIDARGLDAPIAAHLALVNALPGRWDQQRLPVAALDLDLGGKASVRSRLAVQRLAVQLVGGGRLDGSGEWRDDTARLALRLQAVQPAALDARAAAMTLAGSLDLQVSGLPAPDGARPGATHQRGQARLMLESRRDAASVQLSAQVDGEHSDAAWRIDLRQLEARSSEGGRAHATVHAERNREGALQLNSHGEFNDIDPTPWLPGTPSSARPQAADRLTGDWRAELLQARGMAAKPLDLTTLLALRGQAEFNLRQSRLGGVPLQLRVQLNGRQPGWAVDADLRAADNRVALQGQLAPRAGDDHWRIDIAAPALAALQPLTRLHPGWAASLPGLPLAGALAGQGQVQGRWPALATSGTLRASALQAGPLQAASLLAQWQAGPTAHAALAVQLDGQRLAFGGMRADTLQARIDGSLAAHRVALDIVSPLRPPAWTDALFDGGSGGSRLQLRTAGQWRSDQPGGDPLAGRWSGLGLELDARGHGNGAAASRPWLHASGLRTQLRLDGDARVQDASVEPGRIELLGAALGWTQAQWRAGRGDAPAQAALDAALEPLSVAPLLSRRQPGARWGGDLALAGHARLRWGERFSADVVLERSAGDLALSDDSGTQPLGLTDLRLALAAQGGTWHFTQAVAGANLGVLAGAQSLRLPARTTWPSADTPLQGVLEWRVADLGAWAPFTPPGWRLSGTLHTSAALGGRFGAPEIEGQMTGNRLAVRNLLQGVDVRDGELALSLRGNHATVERFVFKGGAGELRLTGGASLGAEPTARLQLNAERFQWLGRFDRRIVASGSAALVLAAQSLQLDGRLRIDEGLIDFSRRDAPRLDADVQVRGGQKAAADATDDAAPAPRAGGTPRQVRVAVQIDLGDNLAVRGRGLDTRLSGKLALSAPGGRLAINGTVRTEGGTYTAYNQKLAIERGLLTFSGPVDSPRLEILAVRPNLDLRVGVQIDGTTQNPRVRLVSEPEMSDTDKLSWLMLGRAPEGLARNDTALLQRTALALLAGEGQGLDSTLMSNLGLDEFSVHQTESGDVQRTVVSLGKQLSRRWYVGYERSVNSTTGTWQLIYRAAQRFTLRAQSGQDNALDAIWTWRWN
jgi:translocation and assembly module TamB